MITLEGDSLVNSSGVPDFRLQTTERHLGCKQKLRHAVNDELGLDGA